MSYDDEAYFSRSEQKILFYGSKVTSAISIMASFYIIIKVIRNPRIRKQFFHRIMVALSVNSILFRGMTFLQSWVVPKSVPVYGAIGTQLTCDIQGFVIVFSYFTILSYYTLLSIFAFYSVRNNFDETWFLKYEVVVHVTLYAFPVIISSIALAKGYFNPSVFNLCHIATYPKRCELVEKHTECIRGGGSFYSNFTAIAVVLTFSAFLASFLLFLGLIIYVRHLENRNIKLIGKQRIGIEDVRKKNRE